MTGKSIKYQDFPGHTGLDAQELSGKHRQKGCEATRVATSGFTASRINQTDRNR